MLVGFFLREIRRGERSLTKHKQRKFEFVISREGRSLVAAPQRIARLN